MEISTGSGDFAFVDSTRRKQADNAVDKGVQCILNCQITVNGTLTAWGQQHNETTLKPDYARAYELPSICTSESSEIVTFLRSLPDSKKTAAVVRSINAAVRWFDSVKIENKKWDWNSDKSDKVLTTVNGSTIWSRFYDLEKSKPMFANRDGKAYDDVTKISLERRTGYAWYGTWCANNIKLGTLPEIADNEPTQTQGTHLYVGYSNQSNNYSTIQAAVDAAANLNPTSESERVSIHIAPGTYREQVRVSTPYISFINDTPSQEVKITWYYGIGYKYYSMGSDGYYNAANAKSQSAKGEATRWGSAVALHNKAAYFRAEYITFENSFNRYVTDEEIADGVEVSGSQSITVKRTKGLDVTAKSTTERAAAIAVEGDYSEFYKCTFLGSQDTLYTRGAHEYFRECTISGNTDYIFGQGDCIFQSCELQWAGYSDNAVGGYISAKTNTGKYLFYDCDVTAASGMKVGSGCFGRPWSGDADVAFVNTKLQKENLIASAGWSKMSNNDPANANFKEYNTTANGKAVSTSGRISGTVRTSGNGLDVDTYLNGWEPYYYSCSGTPSQPVIVNPISGTLIKNLTPAANEYSSLWAIDSSLAVGNRVYTDRDVTYAELPEKLIGAETIVTPCDGKKVETDLATFTANGDVTVYIAFDSRVTSVPSWLSGWNNTSLTAKNNSDVVYNIYSKDFKSGETVTLGTNGQSTGCVGYTAFVKNQAAEPISGNKIIDLTPNDNALPALWAIDTDVQPGDLIYTDRDGVTYKELPENLIGAEAIIPPCDAKKVETDLAVFTAGEDITVYVAVDSRLISVPSWLADWDNNGLTMTNNQDVVYNIYSKDFKSGEQVILHSNEQTIACTGYTVLVTGAYSWQISGDVNMSGKFDASDLFIFQKWLLEVPNTNLTNWEAADLNKDGRLDVFDMTLMRKALINKINEPIVTTTPTTTTTTTTITTTTTTATAANIYESADFKFSGKIYIVGDSTVCNYDETVQNNQNRCGWGMKLGEQYNGVTVTNLARAGRSNRSFLTDNEYKTMCNSIGKGDYLFVQFGHNDEKTTDDARATFPGLDFSTLDSEGKNSAGQYSYEWVILNKYVKAAQAKGATVVLVTPVTRRGSDGKANYKSHIEYAAGLVALGKEYNIPVIDMTTMTAELYTELYNNGGADATAEMHCYTDDTRTAIDNTHLSIKGCTIIADMIADETANLNLKISEKLK